MNKFKNLFKKDNKGFTLVEIIVVLAILAILVAIALPSMTGILEDSKGKVIMQDARAALVAFQYKATSMDSTLITEDHILELIDKQSVATDIKIAVALDANGKITHMVYTDESKVADKAVLITSEGKATDVATMHDSFEKAVDASSETCSVLE